MILFIRLPNRARGANLKKGHLVAAALTCAVAGAIVGAIAGGSLSLFYGILPEYMYA